MRIAGYFEHPYKKWFEGDVLKVKKTHRASENVTVHFDGDEEPELLSLTKQTYGADRLWVILCGEFEEEEEEDDEDDEDEDDDDGRSVKRRRDDDDDDDGGRPVKRLRFDDDNDDSTET